MFKGSGEDGADLSPGLDRGDLQVVGVRGSVPGTGVKRRGTEIRPSEARL